MNLKYTETHKKRNTCFDEDFFRKSNYVHSLILKLAGPTTGLVFDAKIKMLSLTLAVRSNKLKSNPKLKSQIT